MAAKKKSGAAERTRAEEKLLSSAALNESLLDAIPHPAMLIDKDRNIIAANRIARQDGATPGVFCWVGFGKCEHIPEKDRRHYEKNGTPPPGGTACSFCLAEKALGGKEELHEPEINMAGRVWDTYWIPLEGERFLHYAIDITERKLAEERVRESEERYRALFDSSPDSIVILDMDGDVLDCNPAFLKLTGREKKGLIGEHFKDIHVLPEEALPKYLEIFSRITNGDVPPLIEAEILDAKGRHHLLEANVSPLVKDGAVAAFQIISRDVTERVRAEEEIRNLARFPEENPLPVLRIRRDGTISHANSASRDLLMEWNTTAEDSVPPGWKEIIARAFETGNQQTVEEKFMKKHFALHVVPVSGADYVNIYCNDITILKKAEKELEQYSERLEELVGERTDQLTAAYRELENKRKSLVEAQKIGRMGNWDWNIVTNDLTWSEEIYRIFGLAPGGFGATYDAFLMSVHPDDRELVQAAVNEALGGGKPYNIDHRVALPDGVEKVVHEQAEVYRDMKGNPVRMMGTVQDITGRVHAEKALKAREKQLELLSRKVISSQEEERENLARSLHDTLGQRLTAMSLIADWLAIKYGPETEHVGKMKTLITETNIDLHRIYKGLRPMALDKLGLEAALEALVWEYKDGYDFSIKASINPIGSKLAPEKEITIFRILQESLTNVARHAGAARVDVSLRRKDSEVVLEVADDGRGIVADTEADTRLGGFGLTGMGERAALCGGRFEVESLPGRGTLVRARIPAERGRE